MVVVGGSVPKVTFSSLTKWSNKMKYWEKRYSLPKHRHQQQNSPNQVGVFFW